jgi:hypothetical protein
MQYLSEYSNTFISAHSISAHPLYMHSITWFQAWDLELSALPLCSTRASNSKSQVYWSTLYKCIHVTINQSVIVVYRALIGSVQAGFCENRYRPELIGISINDYQNRPVSVLMIIETDR